jgi:hypothetical protein
VASANRRVTFAGTVRSAWNAAAFTPSP